MTKQFTLGKKERLKSRKKIDLLFSKGSKFTTTPFRVFYLISDEAAGSVQFGVGVSNKNFKKAVDRNRIKRLTRESYRLQKPDILEKIIEQQKNLNIFFIYTGHELPEYKIVFEAMKKALVKLSQEIS